MKSVECGCGAPFLISVCASDVEGKREEMFNGGIVNPTEGRAVLHTALRNKKGSGWSMKVDGKDVMGDVEEVLSRVKDFTEQVLVPSVHVRLD